MGNPFPRKLDRKDLFETHVETNTFFTDRNPDTRPLLGGVDVNRLPSMADCEEENGVSSPNSTVSSLSGKRSERDPNGDENDAERASCSRGSDEEDGAGGDTCRKKLRLSKEQSLVLEETFKEHNTLNPVSGIIVNFVSHKGCFYACMWVYFC
jgi:homeobox-leucine zipper protein